jgi:hypothetical protein
MRTVRITVPGLFLLTVLRAILLTPAQIWACTDTVPSAFRTCVGSSGSGSTCSLSSGTYTVCTSIAVGRSSITIEGADITSPGDTILQRGADIQQIMYDATGGGVSYVTVEGITFDGNRYGSISESGGTLNCLPKSGTNYGSSYPPAYYDLDFGGSAGPVTVQWADFINAPSFPMVLGGSASTVSYSNVSQGTSTESAAQTASRTTGLWIGGSESGAYYNAVSYAGTAGIHIVGSNQILYGNLLFNNRYEMTDGIQGGQLVFDAESSAGTAAGNVINGNDWSVTNNETISGTGCVTSTSNGDPQSPSGVEFYGSNHSFYNNEVYNNNNDGMVTTGSDATSNVLISSQNPWDSSDTPRYIESNGNNGIEFLTDVYSSTGVTLDDILVQNNYHGVWMDHVTSSTGFICSLCTAPAACMSGNSGGNLSAVDGTSLTNGLPSNLSNWAGTNSCPTSGSSQQIPAPSGNSNWPW